MEVGKQHVVKTGERNAAGLLDYRYSYWLFSFRGGDVALIARSYDDEPQEAHFLRKEVCGRTDVLAAEDLSSPLFAAAYEHLGCVEGKTRIAVLGTSGYEQVPSPRPRPLDFQDHITPDGTD